MWLSWDKHTMAFNSSKSYNVIAIIGILVKRIQLRRVSMDPRKLDFIYLSWHFDTFNGFSTVTVKFYGFCRFFHWVLNWRLLSLTFETSELFQSFANKLIFLLKPFLVRIQIIHQNVGIYLCSFTSCRHTRVYMFDYQSLLLLAAQELFQICCIVFAQRLFI